MNDSYRFRSGVLALLVQTCLSTIVYVPIARAAVTVCTVNTATDDPASASAAVIATTSSGTLRDCILAANLLTASTGAPTLPGMAITFAPALSGATITLGNDLPQLFNNTSIDASALASPVDIDGGNLHRIFFVSGLPSLPVSGVPDPDGAQPIAISLSSLNLRNGKAKGGDANLGGGGGLGSGGALFINKQATVTLSSVSFSGNSAAGGSSIVTPIAGGAAGSAGGDGASGGGGLGGAGGNCGVCGGGGIGSDATTSTGGSFGGTGIGQISNVQGFGSGFGGGTAGSAGGIGGGGGGGVSGGGNGGFGGGGGNAQGGTGGQGGFFGGGGGNGAFAGLPGGDGGFGGGGGQGSTAGNGGFGAGGGSGSSAGAGGIGGGSHGTGGGGAAGFGGAVFVRSGGTLTVQNAGGLDDISGGSVAFGTGSNNGAAAGTGLFLMSGSALVFDIAGSYTISDTIADDSPSSLPAGNSYTPGNGPGATIAIQGNGTLILAGSNTYAGATAINAGILRVASPGNIQKSAATVAAAGTLTGDGSTGSVASFGTVAPGTSTNPQGTLSVATLNLHPGALTCFHADNVNTIGHLNVAGAATLSGIARIDFSGGPSVGAIYSPLSAASISGTFAGYETNMPNLLGTFSYAATSVTFTVTASDVLFRTGFENTIGDSPCIAAFTN